jgi:hypothetical protein
MSGGIDAMILPRCSVKKELEIISSLLVYSHSEFGFIHIGAPMMNIIKGITPQREVCQYGRAVDEFLRPVFRQKGASQKIMSRIPALVLRYFISKTIKKLSL